MPPKPKQAKLVYGDSVASSGLSVRTFSLSQPLVTIENGIVEKFSADPAARAVNPGVANVIFRRIVKRMQMTARCFSLSGQIPTELREGERIPGELDHPKDVKLLSGFQLPQTGFQHGQVSDEVVDMNASCSSLLSGLSISEPHFHHEDSTGLKSHEKIDFRGTCYDLQLKTDVPVLMMDAKGHGLWTAEDGAFYQVASYGSRAAIENLKLGRFNKIHCLALGLGWWGVAQIDPVGYVEIVNGQAAPGSVLKLREMMDAKLQFLKRKGKNEEMKALAENYAWLNNMTDIALFNKLHVIMEDHSKKLNSTVIDGSVKYEPGFKQEFVELLVGNVIVDDKAHDMLEFPFSLESKSSHLVPGDYVLLSGLMRCLYGNRVLAWTVQGVSELIKARKAELNEQVDDLMERGKRLSQKWFV